MEPSYRQPGPDIGRNSQSREESIQSPDCQEGTDNY